jgi:hypothetical protein
MREMPVSEKTTLREDLRMVHPAAWVLMAIWLLVWVILLIPAIMRKSPNADFVPLVLTVPAAVICLYIFMVFWVNADAKLRRMNSFQWTLIAALVPYGVGFIVYLASRLPIPKPCSACGSVEFASYPFCHSCGARRSQQCPVCGKPVEAGWKVCAHCGQMLPPSAVEQGVRP